jgi:hypothetical protein
MAAILWVKKLLMVVSSRIKVAGFAHEERALEAITAAFPNFGKF